MIHQSIDPAQAKGWFVGPWNSAVPTPIGYANKGIDELHFHEQMFEVYLVARGCSTAVINNQSITLKAGDMLIVEPGETHTFTDNSQDYLHFVIHTPFVRGDKVIINQKNNQSSDEPLTVNRLPFTVYRLLLLDHLLRHLHQHFIRLRPADQVFVIEHQRRNCV